MEQACETTGCSILYLLYPLHHIMYILSTKLYLTMNFLSKPIPLPGFLLYPAIQTYPRPSILI